MQDTSIKIRIYLHEEGDEFEELELFDHTLITLISFMDKKNIRWEYV